MTFFLFILYATPDKLKFAFELDQQRAENWVSSLDMGHRAISQTWETRLVSRDLIGWLLEPELSERCGRITRVWVALRSSLKCFCLFFFVFSIFFHFDRVLLWGMLHS